MGDTETMTRKNKGDMIWDDDIGDVVENCYLDPKGWFKKKIILLHDVTRG